MASTLENLAQETTNKRKGEPKSREIDTIPLTLSIGIQLHVRPIFSLDFSIM